MKDKIYFSTVDFTETITKAIKNVIFSVFKNEKELYEYWSSIFYEITPRVSKLSDAEIYNIIYSDKEKGKLLINHAIIESWNIAEKIYFTYGRKSLDIIRKIGLIEEVSISGDILKYAFSKLNYPDDVLEGWIYRLYIFIPIFSKLLSEIASYIAEILIFVEEQELYYGE